MSNTKKFCPMTMGSLRNKLSTYRVGFFLAFVYSLSLAALPPKPDGPISDFAGTLSGSETAALDQMSRCIFKTLDCAIIVAILPSLDNGDIDQTANELYNTWGIGSRGSNRGVLICLALKDRAIRIETGYGAEGFLPDAVARRIIAAYRPLLTQGKSGAALSGIMASIGQTVSGDKGLPLDSTCFSAALAVSAAPQELPLPQHSGWFLVLFVIFLLFLVGTPMGRAMLPWILLMLLSGNGRGGRGGGFGGGLDGGGFGGFGGGSSGGGGASGRF